MSIPQWRGQGNPSGLRVFLVGTGGHASLILRSLLSNGETVVGICCSPDRSHSSVRSRAKRFVRSKLVHMGLYHKPDFAFSDHLDSRVLPGSIASRKGIPMLDPRGLRTGRFEAALRALEPDIGLMCGFRRLIPESIIRIPKVAFVNIHTSLLPKHRGGTPSRWVVRHGERETGVTAHFVNTEYDRGDIIMQKRIAAGPDETSGELDDRLANVAVPIAHRVLDMASRGDLSGYPQQEDFASHEPSYGDVHRRIKWELEAREIRQICYAIRPGSGGTTAIGSTPLCVWDLEVVDGVENTRQLPGTVIEVDQRGQPLIACGTGAVRILEFLYSGTIVPARKVVRWCNIRKGSVLGSWSV